MGHLSQPCAQRRIRQNNKNRTKNIIQQNCQCVVDIFHHTIFHCSCHQPRGQCLAFDSCLVCCCCRKKKKREVFTLLLPHRWGLLRPPRPVPLRACNRSRTDGDRPTHPQARWICRVCFRTLIRGECVEGLPFTHVGGGGLRCVFSRSKHRSNCPKLKLPSALTVVCLARIITISRFDSCSIFPANLSYTAVCLHSRYCFACDWTTILVSDVPAGDLRSWCTDRMITLFTDWPYWVIFIPLWVWKSIATLGAIVGAIVWCRYPHYR